MWHDSTYTVPTAGKPLETERRFVVARGRGRGGGVTADGYRVSFWADRNILEPDRGAGCA